jgi:hypothetical protein
MQHATPEALLELADLLASIREQPGVREPRPGTFYCKGKALAHFHVDPSGLYADARIGPAWSRLRVSEPGERADFLRLLEGEITARR